jgi:hypothetical protein
MHIETTRFIPAGSEARGSDDARVSSLITAPKEDLVSRWKTNRGKEILAYLSKQKFCRSALEEAVGKMDGRFDLRGIPLSNIDLSGVDLTNIDFFSSDLSCAKLIGSDLSNTHLSECELSGTDLSWTKLTNSFFDNVKFDASTSLLGVNINEMNSNLAILLIDQANTQQRIAHIQKRHPWISLFLKVSCDYGRSITRLLGWGIVMIFTFAVIYAQFPGALQTTDHFEILYFSIVTTTTLGYGDIAPSNTFGQFIVMLQVTLGYIFGGLLVAIIARRVITLNI